MYEMLKVTMRGSGIAESQIHDVASTLVAIKFIFFSQVAARNLRRVDAGTGFMRCLLSIICISQWWTLPINSRFQSLKC